jgi:hypothetical protein
MTQPKEELQDRTCRSCGKSYRYPVIKSNATRFYCEECIALPRGMRAICERLNKRLVQLEKKVGKLG